MFSPCASVTPSPKQLKEGQLLASQAARAAARTAHRGGCWDCCGAEVHQRRRLETKVRQQDTLPRPLREEKAVEAPKDSEVELCIFLQKAQGLPKADFMGTADPYVELLLLHEDPLSVDLPKSELRGARGKLFDQAVFRSKSRVVRGSLAPEWNETYYCTIPHGALTLYLRVLDYDLVVSDDFLGHCSMGVLDALESSRALGAGWRALLRQSSAPERLAVLRDPRVAEAPVAPTAHRLLPPKGQESTYDLSSAELFLQVTLSGRSVRQLPKAADTEETCQEMGEAARSNELWQILKLSSHYSVNARLFGEFRGCTPLHIACLQQHSDAAMALVEVCRASLIPLAPGGLSAAMCACMAGAESLAEWLVCEGVPADLRDDEGKNLLFYAASHACPELTAFLLSKQHLSPACRASDGSTPLHAAGAGANEKAVVVAKQLLEAKASVNHADGKGNLPLHEACRAGNDKCVKLLVGSGSALTALDEEGKTPYELGQASLPQATLRLLEAGQAAAKNPAPASSRQPGETFREAEKRELRARKAAISAEAEASWQAWRAQHPRTETGLERNGFGASAEDLEDPFFNLPQPSPEAKASVANGKSSWRVPGLHLGARRFGSYFSWAKRPVRGTSP
ncbi:unnamed protein product [Effrenium voratum]|uniref:C2 domain-containing protein n=1 Tax=Effrenium voratum TaxID=2562239 RepID=A0AA36J5G6_9DINO|nr:unnamed protein product [Effrenium voratum]